MKQKTRFKNFGDIGIAPKKDSYMNNYSRVSTWITTAESNLKTL